MQLWTVAVVLSVVVPLITSKVHDNEIATEDYLQDLVVRDKKSPAVITDNKKSFRSPVSESSLEMKNILIEDIRHDIADLEKLTKTQSKIKAKILESIGNNSSSENPSSVNFENDTSLEAESLKFETSDNNESSRVTRQNIAYGQYQPNKNINGKYMSSDNIYPKNIEYQRVLQPSINVYRGNGDPYVAMYNLSPRTFGPGGAHPLSELRQLLPSVISGISSAVSGSASSGTPITSPVSPVTAGVSSHGSHHAAATGHGAIHSAAVAGAGAIHSAAAAGHNAIHSAAVAGAGAIHSAAAAAHAPVHSAAAAHTPIHSTAASGIHPLTIHRPVIGINTVIPTTYPLVPGHVTGQPHGRPFIFSKQIIFGTGLGGGGYPHRELNPSDYYYDSPSSLTYPQEPAILPSYPQGHSGYGLSYSVYPDGNAYYTPQYSSNTESQTNYGSGPNTNPTRQAYFQPASSLNQYSQTPSPSQTYSRNGAGVYQYMYPQQVPLFYRPNNNYNNENKDSYLGQSFREDMKGKDSTESKNLSVSDIKASIEKEQKKISDLEKIVKASKESNLDETTSSSKVGEDVPSSEPDPNNNLKDKKEPSEDSSVKQPAAATKGQMAPLL